MPTYNVADEPSEAGVYTFASKSRPGLVHTVVVDTNGVRCTCEGWKYRKHCRHIDEISYRRQDALGT
jgi:hypothetical protein